MAPVPSPLELSLAVPSDTTSIEDAVTLVLVTPDSPARPLLSKGQTIGLMRTDATYH